MNRTMISPRFEFIEVDLPSVQFTILTNDRFDVFDVIDSA